MNVQHNNNETNPQGKNLRIRFAEIDSTNTWAKNHPELWAPEGMTIVTASEQTAGRGRFDRRWESPPGVNVYATFCFKVDPGRPDIGRIPQLLALSACLSLIRKGFDPRIKWPNDILLSEKKTAGILCETILHNEMRGVVCGIGINVNMSRELLIRIDRPATSLFVESGVIYDPEEIFSSVLEEFDNRLPYFLAEGFQKFFPLYCELSIHKKGQRVRFHDNQKLIDGQFDSLESDGSVRLVLPDGTSKIFYAGEFVAFDSPDKK